MFVDFDKISAKEGYFLLTQAVIPRPIAWVLTENETGEGNNRYNLAPFSFFNVVSAAPPLLVLGFGARREGPPRKDTLHNLETRKKATIHIVSEPEMMDMVDSSAELPPNVSELSRRPYTLVPGPEGALPRISTSKLALFCELDHVHNVNEGGGAVAFLRLRQLFVDEGVTMENEKNRLLIDPLKILPVARLGQNHYTVVKAIEKVDRPEG